MYSDHLVIHIDTSKGILLEEYKKKYKPEEMTRARVTRPLIAANSANPPSAHPSTSKNFGERTRRLLNERAAAAASTDDNRMVIAKNRPVEVDPTPPARHFFRCRLLPQVSGNSRGCFYLEMRSIHITVPVQ